MSGDRPTERELREIAGLSPNGGGPPASSVPWPEPLASPAFHSLAGRVVRRIEPQSEADPAALLLQLLVGVGIACGRGPHFVVEATRHGLNEFCVICGETSKGRKGTGFDRVHQPIALADASFPPRVMSGLSSGEGLVWEVRDMRTARRRAKKGEQADEDGHVTEIVDEGVFDKRLLVYEPEFSNVLSVMERTGNNLAAMIRNCWDGRDLATRAKNSPLHASAPHIGMTAHITAEELTRRLTETHAADGFGNRFLWCCSRRSKLLPRGGKRIDWGRITSELAAAVGPARDGHLGEIELDFEAGALWDERYEELSTGGHGLLGAISGRGEARVRRLATIYAVLDREPEVRLAHLEAALEVWRYCEDSCRYLFADRTGDPIADTILAAVRRAAPEGVTRTAIRDVFGRNVSADRIEGALTRLAANRLARMGTDAETGGRPAEIWFAITAEGK
jgi:hypothetical protein